LEGGRALRRKTRSKSHSLYYSAEPEEDRRIRGKKARAGDLKGIGRVVVGRKELKGKEG